MNELNEKKLTISAVCWACEQSLPASYYNTTRSTETIFLFCICRLHESNFAVVMGVVFARKSCFISCCCCGNCLQIFVIGIDLVFLVSLSQYGGENHS